MTTRGSSSDYRIAPARSDDIALSPMAEALEPRLMLSAAQFATDLPDAFVVSAGGGALTIGVDGFDADGDALTITAVSDNSDLNVFIPTGNRYALMHFVTADGVTPIGDIMLQLFETRSAPAAERFITLATNYVNPDGSLDPGGIPFYTDVDVHRVIDDFMIQTGDAANGDGTGGSPLGTFDDLFDPLLSFTGRGVLAMANSGPDTNDSQFFITEVPTNWLDGKHMVFGQIISGWDTLETISEMPVDGSSRPIDTPLLASVDIIESDQDATVTIWAGGSFSGEANVTVTLDDGQGGQAVRTITIVDSASMLTLPEGGVTVVAGQAGTFIAGVVDDPDGSDPTVQITVDDVIIGAAVSIDPVTHEVSIVAPTDYAGVFSATVSATWSGFDNTDSHSETFYILSRADYTVNPLGHFGVDADGAAIACFELNGLMYVASGQAGIEIFDISDPGNPVRLGGYDTPGSAREIEVIETTIGADAALVAFVADTWEGIRVLDVTDPANITELDSYDTETDATATGAAVSLSIDGDVLYVPVWMDGLLTLDVTDPTNVIELDTISQLTDVFTISRATAVAVAGDYAYLVDTAGVIIVLNVSNPADMQYVTLLSANGFPWDIDIMGDRLYVPSQEATGSGGGLTVYDISTPESPVQAGFIAIEGDPWMVDVQGDLAVVALTETKGEFVFVDISDAANMSVEYTFSGPAMSGDPLYFDGGVALPFSDGGVALVELAQAVAITSPAVADTVELGLTYRIEWSGGIDGEVVQLWANSSAGWVMLADGLDAADGGYDWDTTGVRHGWYCFVAQVNPGAGLDWYNSNSPNWVHVVDPANHAPTIEITNPATPMEVVEGEPFTVRWTADDGDGDDLHVSLWAYSADTGWFQMPGAEWLTAASGAGEFVWDTTDIGHGWYCFSAWVMDGSEAGVVGSPNFVHVTLPVGMMPTLSFLTPTAGGDEVDHGQAYDLSWSVDVPTGESMQVQLWAFYLDAADPSADAYGRVWVELSGGLVDADAGTFAVDTAALDAGRWYAFAANLFRGDVFIAVGSDNWLHVV